jgi:hypothetical protein
MEEAQRPGRQTRGQRNLDPLFAGELDDEVLSAEITLLGDLVLAATRVARHLTEDEVDQILGVDGHAP